MKKPAIPQDEAIRISRLHSLGALYSPAEERFDRITRLARKIFHTPIALISLVSERCQWFKSAQGLLPSETPREISFCGHAILNEDTLIIPDTLLNPDFADNPLVTSEPFIRFYAGHPLQYQGSPMGTLCIIDRNPRELLPSELETLRSLSIWAENELQIAALSEAQNQLLDDLGEARRQALIDPLTKVWNRKGMDELLGREMENARRKKERVTLMLLDVDHYKKVNDRYGHVVGDIALKEIAQRIRSSVRPHDVIARYGGDEFLVFASDCTGKTAKQLANRILARISNEQIDAGDVNFDIGLSIGVSLATATSELSMTQLIELADTALYGAKNSGRNCIEYKTLDQ